MLKSQYGVTEDQFVALLSAQGDVCGICGGQPPNTGNRSGQWNIDHCHVTGKVRGVLCSPCNIGIGQLKDSPDMLRKAIAYLERFGH